MKKKFICIFISFILIFLLKPIVISATSNKTFEVTSLALVSTEVIYHDDGSFIVTQLSKGSIYRTDNVVMAESISNVVGYMDVIRYSSSGAIT